MGRDRGLRVVFAVFIVAALAIIGRNFYRRHLTNALCEAVQNRDVAAVRALLNKGVSPDTHMPPADESLPSQASLSALDWTMSHLYRDITTPQRNTAAEPVQTLQASSLLDPNSEQMACLLLRKGASLPLDARQGNVYLLQACRMGSLSLLIALLDRGLRPDTACLAEAARYATPPEPALQSPKPRLMGAGSPMLLNMLDKSEIAQRAAVSLKMKEILQAHGAQPDMQQIVEQGDVAQLKAMLNRGTFPFELQSGDAEAPLAIAAHKGNREIINLLLTHGADVNEQGRYEPPLCRAVEKGDVDVVNLLLARGAKVNIGLYQTPLKLALANKRADIARLLLSRGADPNFAPKNGTSFTLATAIDNTPELVPELLKRGANVNAFYGEPLRAALRSEAQGRLALVRELLRHGANVNPPPFPGLPIPVSATLDPTQANKIRLSPHSPLLNAACNAPECVALLRRAGATVEPERETILPAAARYGRLDLVDRLLSLGANINGMDEEGETALSRAIVNAPEGISPLLQKGADPNMATRAQHTPLALAAIRENGSLIRLLLARGANVNLRPPRGHNALYWARKHNKPEIIALLTQAGANPE